MLLRNLFAICTLLLASSGFAMEFTVHDPCGGGNASYCAPRILGAGEIEMGDDLKLRRRVSEWQKEHGTYFSGITLHSAGGNLMAGMLLGQEIRRLKLDTVAPVKFEEWNKAIDGMKVLVPKVQCHSACVYAFAGGVDRSVEPGAIFGVHQFASKSPNASAESDAQRIATMLRAYVNAMGVAPELIDIASMVPADDIRVLTQAQLRTTKLDNTTVRETIGWTVNVTSDGSPSLAYGSRLDGGRVMTLRLMRLNANIVLYLSVDLGTIMDASRVAAFPVGSRPDVHIKAQGRDFVAGPLLAWRAMQGSPRGFEAAVALSGEVLQTMVATPAVILTDQSSGRALSDLLPWYAPVATEGLREGVQLLLRVR